MEMELAASRFMVKSLLTRTLRSGILALVRYPWLTQDLIRTDRNSSFAPLTLRGLTGSTLYSARSSKEMMLCVRSKLLAHHRVLLRSGL